MFLQEASKLKEAAKHKQKELLHNNSKQDAHHYEKQAISSMMRSLSVSEDSSATATQLQATSPAQEAKNWSRVVDKKEQKRKQAETQAKQDQQQSLPERERTISERTPIKEQTPPPTTAAAAQPTTPTESSTPLSKSYNLDLSSLMPQSAKLSQKQRKRLSSESQSWRANSSAVLETPPPPVAVPNAWGVTPSSPPTYPEVFSSPPAAAAQPATGSIADPTSFANMMRGQMEQSNSFSKILADEKRQRESYERMRNKSLVHTQIEETAIAELREFYNVDRIDDENITIERKSRPSNINFSTWTKQ